MTRNCSY